MTYNKAQLECIEQHSNHYNSPAALKEFLEAYNAIDSRPDPKYKILRNGGSFIGSTNAPDFSNAHLVKGGLEKAEAELYIREQLKELSLDHVFRLDFHESSIYWESVGRNWFSYRVEREN